MQHLTLHLASSSPRRRDILDALGLRYSAAGVDIDERRLAGESPQAMVRRLAAEKASAAAGKATLVLGADTAVVVDDCVLGKPTGAGDAVDMLLRLGGRSHRVMTGVALQTAAGVKSAMSLTEVTFRDIDPDEAAAYWQSGEPRDKAGAYAIQGRGGVFVRSLSGSYSGVVGLPVFETAELLLAAGLKVLTPVSTETAIRSE